MWMRIPRLTGIKRLGCHQCGTWWYEFHAQAVSPTHEVGDDDAVLVFPTGHPCPNCGAPAPED